MRIAIVGTGISGLVAAYLLSREHEVTVFEANGYIGGHTHTIPVERFGRQYAVDTGFIVFNPRTYPNFVELLDQLGVESQPTTMSFSVRCERTGLEYNGTDLNRLFSQRRNVLRPSFYRMLADTLRFYREAPGLLTAADESLTLGDYLLRARYSQPFIDWHLIPLGAAIWSADPRRMLEFPARHLIEFFSRHGFLQVGGRPGWRVIRGGSHEYVGPLVRGFRDRIRLRCAVRTIARTHAGVRVTAQGSGPERFDAVVLATHSDQALSLLADASRAEREILGAIPYQRNEVVLHTDARLLPRSPRAWAAWNYHLLPTVGAAAALTYNMNILQGIESPEPFCVTLNRGAAIDPAKVITRMTYHHPVYTRAALTAQRRWAEINGVNRTYFCGAYWGDGFHEDGVKSALAVSGRFGLGLRDGVSPQRLASANAA